MFWWVRFTEVIWCHLLSNHGFVIELSKLAVSGFGCKRSFFSDQIIVLKDKIEHPVSKWPKWVFPGLILIYFVISNFYKK